MFSEDIVDIKKKKKVLTDWLIAGLMLMFMLIPTCPHWTLQRHKHKHKHKKNRIVRFSCAYAYAYVERVTSENYTRQIIGFVLLMFLLMLMFMSPLFSLVLRLMLLLVFML